DLDVVLYPTQIGSVLFEQVRKREGGAFEVQIKPNNDLTFGLNGLLSTLYAKNYEQNFMAWPDNLLTSGVVPTSYTVKNGTLTQANFPVQGEHAAAVVDSMYRPGSRAQTWYLNLDGTWRASNRFRVTGQLGTTKGTGETAKEVAFEGNINNAGLNYSMNGLRSPVAVSFPGANVADFAGTSFGWAWGDRLRTLDSEAYGELAGEYVIGSGTYESIKFGARFANHERSIDYPVAVGPASSSPDTLPTWNGALYPANFGKEFGGILNRIWLLNPLDVEAWADHNLDTDPSRRRNWAAEFKVKEDTAAGYAVANLADDGWRANVGVRVVRTDQTTANNIGNPPDPVTGEETGFTPVVTKRHYVDVLPSANIKFDLTRDMVLRAAVARTMSRPDFSALGGAVTLDNIQGTGTAGNPNLNPVRSTNYDVSAEWYFAPKSLLQFGLFCMDFSSYVSLATAPAQYFNNQTGRFEIFQITSPINVGATNKGFEIAYQQALFRNFGVLANYTYADGKEADGSEMVGSSRHTYSLTGYYENDRVYARLAYNHRSDFLVGLDRSFAQHAAGTGNLAASLGYRLNKYLMLSFEALNLNNPSLKYYGTNKDQPRAFYSSGRQFYFGVKGQM
ncbi:MAG: TonB-dependent receptor, partial [Noviherbaspirillum sp.]